MKLKMEITYMVDPGDGLERKAWVFPDTDHMAEALGEWMSQNEYFVTKCQFFPEEEMRT
jgi:hypothetical protein